MLSELRSVAGDRRPPSRGDQQRARIIAAVTDLLGTVPIGELSVSRIAQHAGVTRPAFYFYFESKYAVLAVIFDEVWNELDTATRGLVDDVPDQPLVDFADQVLANAIDVWLEHAGLLNACVFARQSDAQLDQMWQRLMSNLESKIVTFTRTASSAGLAQTATTDVESLIKALLGMTVWVLHENYREPQSRERLIEAVHAVWLAAVWGIAPTARQGRTDL